MEEPIILIFPLSAFLGEASSYPEDKLQSQEMSLQEGFE